MSPSLCQRQDCEIKLFPKVKFELRIKSGGEHSFQIVNDDAFVIHGYSDVSDYSDTCCCEQVWNDYYELEKDKELTDDKIFVSYHNDYGKVRCTIGERMAVSKITEKDDIISECRWLCVKMNTTDDVIVNEKYNAIFYELLPSANLHRRMDSFVKMYYEIFLIRNI